MSDGSSEVNPLDALAEEIVARHRRGERPALSEYVTKYPALADEIQDLFPALVMMEEVRPDKADVTGALSDADHGDGKKLERLGDYRILREVGRGGMGIVYEAEQESLGRHVALKVLPAHALLDPQRLRRFNREAKSAARLHHTNIVPVYGVGESDGLHYYVMQFIQGLGLDQVLAELRKLRRAKTAPTTPEPPSRLLGAGDLSAVDVARSLLTGHFTPTKQAIAPGEGEDVSPPTLSLPSAPSPKGESSSTIHLPGQREHTTLSETGRQYWQSVARIGVQVADAMAYANGQGTLHRDIKPSNLLLDTQGTVWVADFGLAKATDSEDLTHAGDIVGTIRYMAPERFRGQCDAASDVYSLGLTLYELLTLRPAFEEVGRDPLILRVSEGVILPPRKIDPAIPADLETIVLKAIARDPAHRYATASDMAADLHRFLEDKPIRARRVSAAEKAWRWCRRNPALASLTAAVLLLLFFGAIASSLAAYHFSRMADEARRLERDALAAKKDAEDKSQEISDGLERLRRANAFSETGRLKADDGHWDEAMAAYTAAIEQRPDLAFVWFDRAAYRLQFFQWEEAAKDFDKGFELQPPSDPSYWHSHAALRLYLGDVDGYRQLCKGMFKRFGQTSDPKTAEHLARACTLGPDALDDWTPLVQLMEKMIADNPDMGTYVYDHAALLLRSGQPVLATRRCEAFQQRYGVESDLFSQLILALAYRQISMRNKADERLAHVSEVLNAQLASLSSFVANETLPSQYLSFYDPDVCVLRREARKALVQAASPEEEPIHWVTRSRGHALLKQWHEATSAAERAIASRPDDYQLRLERGRLYTWQKRWAEAAADFGEAIRRHPQDGHVWYERGRMFVLQERWVEAAADFDEAMERPFDPQPQNNARSDEGPSFVAEIVQAEPVFNELTRRRPTDAHLWVIRGRLQNERGKAADALAALTKAIAIQPDNANLYWERGSFSFSDSQWDAAAADYVKVLDLIEDYPSPGYLKSNVLSTLRSNDKALAKALELQPENLDLLAARAGWHAARNENEFALRDYARVLDKDPTVTAARTERSRLYLSLGRWSEAAADYQKVVGDAVVNDDWFQLAALHILAGHSKEYTDFCDKTIRVHAKTKDSDIDFNSGRILSLGPADAEAREQGARWAERAVGYNSRNVWYLHALALAHYRAGRYDQAVKRLKESQKFSPEWGGPLNPLLLALCYQALKLPDDAQEARRKAAEWLDKINLDRPRSEWELPPAGFSLSDWVEYQVLRREAERVFQQAKP